MSELFNVSKEIILITGASQGLVTVDGRFLLN
jgi:hypothetical protein